MTTRTAQPDLPAEGGWSQLVESIASASMSAVGREGKEARRSWREAGLGELTVGASGNQLAPIGPFAERMDALASLLPVDVEPLRLLRERSAIAGLRGRRSQGGQGSTSSQSVGGTAWMVAAADGWFCLNLARQEDAASLPALLEADVDHRDWDRLQSAFRGRLVADLDHRAFLLGLPACVVPSAPLALVGASDPQLAAREQDKLGVPFLVDDVGEARFRDQPLVLDLTSLWAGPLCGSLLADAGCRVIKVEGRYRPDGARSGPEEFFNLMNGGKECIALDFADPVDRSVLGELLDLADVVLEGSRPRVLEGLGIDPWRHVRQRRSCWVSITAYGRTGPWSNRVGFGDDIAAGAGVVAWSADQAHRPSFVGDAIADPVGGCLAAVAVWHALSAGRSAMIDLSLREALGFQWGDTTLTDEALQDRQDRQDRQDSKPVNVRRAQAARAKGFDADGARIRGFLREDEP